MALSDEVARYYAARAEEYDVSAGYADAIAEELRAPIKARFQEVLRGHDVLEIACGTGYWTEVIAATARSVLATDVNPAMMAIARRRVSSLKNVRCQVADAYSLDGVSGRLTAAFAHWWWSHVSKALLGSFLTVLHSKLVPGAFVLFADQLPYERENCCCGDDGNRTEERRLRGGRSFHVVKNFPTEHEIRAELRGVVDRLTYTEYPEERYWTVGYWTKAHR